MGRWSGNWGFLPVFFPILYTMGKRRSEIQFIDSFRADTAIVGEIMKSLETDLKSMKYPRSEIDEILVAADEAVTNAIQGTLRKRKAGTRGRSAGREITVRYHVTDEGFDATIIDHGGGLDMYRCLKEIPDATSADYHRQVMDYTASKARTRKKLVTDGREMPSGGVGAGLKILLSFMDSVEIALIDRRDIVGSSVTGHTDGTILNIRRRRRYG